MARTDDERHAARIREMNDLYEFVAGSPAPTWFLEIFAHQPMEPLIPDSGATHHMVGNPWNQSNLRDQHRGVCKGRSHKGVFFSAARSEAPGTAEDPSQLPRFRHVLYHASDPWSEDDIARSLDPWCKWDRRCINCSTYCFCSASDLKFTVQTTATGGVDIKFGARTIRTIHAPKHLRGSREFSSNKPIPPSGVTGFIGSLSTEPSRRDGAHQPPPLPAPADEEVVISNLEVPLEPKVDSGASIHVTGEIRLLSEVRLVGPGQSVKIPDGRILQIRAIGRIRRPGFDIPNVYLVDGLTEMLSVGQLATDAQTSADSVHFVIDSGSSFLASAASLDEQLTPNDLGYERNNEPHSNGSAAIASSAKTTCVPLVHKHTDNGSQHHSYPDSGVTERGKVEETTTWVFATGAAHHATGNPDLIVDFEAVCDVEFVYAADGTQMQVLGRGNVVTQTVVLPGVLYVPGLTTNLVSVGQLAELDYTIAFGRAACLVSSPADGTVVGRAHTRDDGLYVVDNLKIPIPSSPRRRIDQHTST